jgi:hypothetical protein
MLKAGATRIGSSAGVKIVKEWKRNMKGTISSQKDLKDLNVKREREIEGRKRTERKN